MGNTNTTIRNSTNVNVDVSAIKECGVSDLLATVTNGTMSVQETKTTVENTQSFTGEISADLCTKNKHTYLMEAEKIVLKVVYTLPEANIGVPNYQGFGHIVLRQPRRCTSIQMCLDNLTINQTTATAIYHGYLERNFEVCPFNKTKVDVHVSFMITCVNA